MNIFDVCVYGAYRFPKFRVGHEPLVAENIHQQFFRIHQWVANMLFRVEVYF
jgi:hypothetical protein